MNLLQILEVNWPNGSEQSLDYSIAIKNYTHGGKIGIQGLATKDN